MQNVNLDDEGEVATWTVLWFSPTKGSCKGCFRPAKGCTEDLPAEEESTVCVFDKLISNGKKLPAKAIKEAILVLKAAWVAEDNGCGSTCIECSENQEGEPMVRCECCGKTYHQCCAPGLHANNVNSWWCPGCIVTHGV